jgi:putative membrane protein
MTGRRGSAGWVRAAIALAGLLLAVGLGWYALPAAGLALLFDSWVVPAVALLHLVQQALCGFAWHRLVVPPRPTPWAFFRARWVRASVAALVPVSGVGAALVALRLSRRAGLAMDHAIASLTLDATIEMITQVMFLALGFALLLGLRPQQQILWWSVTVLSASCLAIGLVVAAQRGGALKLIEAGITRLAARWPRWLPLAEARLHDRLMHLHRQRRAALVAGSLHLGAWLFGAIEIWAVLYAVGKPAGPAECIIIESLSMAARSAGFFVPGALGIQELGLVIVGGLVGLPAETAMLIAIVKRLRDVAIGVPGLVIWQWAEHRRLPATTTAGEPTAKTPPDFVRRGCR